jgi:hypothetical protein
MFTIGSERQPKDFVHMPLVHLTRLCIFVFPRRLTLAQGRVFAVDRERAFRQEEVSYGPAQFCFDKGLLA